MKETVVIGADTGWSIGRIHRDIAKHLDHKYEFQFFNFPPQNVPEFVAAVHNAQHCITTYNWHNYITQLFPDPAQQAKIVIVCHGYPEVVLLNGQDHNGFLIHHLSEDSNQPSKRVFANEHDTIVYPLKHDLSPFLTYAVTSDVLLPFFANIPKVYVTTNGIDETNFTYKQRSGTIKSLGWCGAPIGVKRHWIGLSVARNAKLPISFAMTLCAEDLKEWYTTIDILLVTSGPAEHDETGPLPPFEAVASGCVVLGFPIGNFRNIPGPKCYSVQDLVDAIQELQKDPMKYKELAAKQYEFVTTHWSMKTLVQQWDAALQAKK